MLYTAMKSLVAAMQASPYNEGADWEPMLDSATMLSDEQRIPIPDDVQALVDDWGLVYADPEEKHTDDSTLPAAAQEELNRILGEQREKFPEVLFAAELLDMNGILLTVWRA